jgi:hypothetical protein
MGDSADASQDGSAANNGKKQILLNAFDMSTVGHLSPGQWKVGIGLYSQGQNADSFTEPQRQVCDQANTRILDRVGEAVGARWNQCVVSGRYNWRS